MPRLTLSLILAAAPAWAEPLSPASRDILGAEIRALLTAEPELARPALERDQPFRLPETFNPYADDAAADLQTLTDSKSALFAPERTAFGDPAAPLAIALFTARDCPDCAAMLQSLEKLAATNPIRVTLFDLDKDAALARAIGATSAPYTAFPDMFLNGDIPAAVLQRYIDKALAD